MDNQASHPTLGVSRLFRRYQAGLVKPPETDEWGFVEESSELVGFDALSTLRAVLVVGPPWIGKTFVAEQIQTLELLDGDQFPTKLHHHSIGLPLQPPGWGEWVSSVRRANWIVDSLDEGELIQENVHQIILHDLRALTPLARNRLRVIVFCREANLPESFRDALTGVYADEFAAFELLGLTQAGARHMLGEATFSRVLGKIREHGLHSVAQFPAPLKYIERHLDEPLTKAVIWEGVLKELLEEKSERKQKRAFNDPETEERFRAATQLACVMTFAGVDRVSTGDLDSSSRPLRELIRESPPGVGPSRAAARRALETAMFTRGRFSQKHLREWMCAFALKDMAPGRLKVLLTEPDGPLHPGHMGILSLLTQLGKPETKDWIVTKNGGLLPQSDQPLSLADVCQILDRLEQIAEDSRASLRFWDEPSVRQLRVGGLGEELAIRLGDKSRSLARRVLLLQIASTTDSPATVEAAIDILCELALPHELIEAALVVVKRLAAPGQLFRLDEFVRSARPTSRVHKACVSAIIKRFLDEGFWTIDDAARHAPEPHDDVVDSTHMLEHVLMQALTVPAAMIVIERMLPAVLSGASESSSSEREKLFHRAIAVVLEQETPSESALDALIPLAIRQWELECHLRFDFSSGFRKSEPSRRKLYLAELRYHRDQGNEATRRSFRWILLPDDVEWLIDQLPAAAGNEDEMLDDLLVVAGRGSEKLQARARAFVQSHSPGVVGQFDEGLKRRKIWEEEQRTRNELAVRAKSRRDVEIRAHTTEILDHADCSLQQKMWALSKVCFPSDHARPSNLIGTWDDLDPNTQDRILGVCASAINHCEPTPIPLTNSVPQTLLFEAWCFRATVMHRPQQLKLDSVMIAKWLPALLHWTIYSDATVIDMCCRTDRRATEQVFLEAIERELQLGSRPAVTVSNMPAQLWTPPVRDKLVQFMADAQFAPSSRGDLLDRISQHDPSIAIPLARNALNADAKSDLGKAALNVLLRLSPNDAWPQVRDDFENGRSESLLLLGQLYDFRNRDGFNDWPAERLVEMTSMLFSAFPPGSDAEDVDGWLTPETLCCQLRDAIPSILFNRGGSEDRKALTKLVADQPQLQPWFDRALAEEKARRILGVSSSQFLPLESVLDALANADYRFVRHAGDLIEVIEEQLGTISATICEDVELFYRKQDRSSQVEGTLQAYFLRRLFDRLPGRVLAPNTTVVYLAREHQGKFLRRTDILVTATCLDGTQAAVVIEIKWSSNAKISTSLAVQLGDQYLLAEGRTHGIYLVAWNGRVDRWKPSGRQVIPKSCQELQCRLDGQAVDYNRTHEGIRVDSIVFDLAWPTKKPHKRSSRKPKSKLVATRAAQKTSRKRKKT